MPLIPFNKPFIAGKELYYVAQAVTYGNLSGDGHFTQRCSEFLRDTIGAQEVLMTPSCTAALEMAAILCDLDHGDEVIMPSYTFVSTANAFVRAGATPVFVYIRPDTLNIDDSLIEEAITGKHIIINCQQFSIFKDFVVEQLTEEDFIGLYENLNQNQVK